MDADTEAPSGKKRKDISIVSSYTIAEKLTVAFAFVSVILAVITMIMGNGFVKFAGLLLIIVAPYTAYQQTQLTDIAALETAGAKVEEEVNLLKERNARLRKNEQEVRDTVDRLGDVEEALHVITNTHGESIREFAGQVKENEEILEKMKENLRQSAVQNLLSVITRSDTNNDKHIDEDETEILLQRIKNINMIELDENRFRNAVRKSGGSLRSVITIAKNLLNSAPKGNETVFTLSM